MEFSIHCGNIDWIPVVLLTIVSFAIGMLWHQSFLFGKHWKKENYGEAEVKVNAPLVFGGTALVHLLVLVALSALISGTCGLKGMGVGAGIAVLFVFPAMAGTYLFANRSIKLLLIDTGMYLVLYAVSGLLLGIF